MHKSGTNMFSPKMQGLFWKNLEPDLTSQMRSFESKESWTHSFEDFPEFFTGVEELTKICSTRSPSGVDEIHIRVLIKILSAMSYSQSLSAMSYLDMHYADEENIGWSAKIFLEAANIYKKKENAPLNKESKAIYERVITFSRTKLFSDLFTNDFKFGDKK